MHLSQELTAQYSVAMMPSGRIIPLNQHPPQVKSAYVLYWMQAAQRAQANHALCFASQEADRLGLPLLTLFVLSEYPQATPPQYRWMLAGLRQTAAILQDAGIGFLLRRGNPLDIVLEVASQAALVVVDRSPSRWAVSLKKSLAELARTRVVEVDGESLIPEALASPKQEWSARTLRLKIDGAIDGYAQEPVPEVPTPHARYSRAHGIGADLYTAFDGQTKPAYQGDRSPEQVLRAEPGEMAALVTLEHFVTNKLDSYDFARNDPTKDGTSSLSAYLHFGHISPLVVIKAAREADSPGFPAFREQCIVRRELCRNFTRYRHADYDSWEGLPAWSRSTLEAASLERRTYNYSRAQFEAAETHDTYWNAAQEQLVRSGTIHNYMRMYWGKMLLAWSANPQDAFSTALYLNDRYALDGRDPNGWAGIGWCFGLHDRPWPHQPFFGTVRAMSSKGLRRKFDADQYARTWCKIRS